MESAVLPTGTEETAVKNTRPLNLIPGIFIMPLLAELASEAGLTDSLYCIICK